MPVSCFTIVILASAVAAVDVSPYPPVELGALEVLAVSPGRRIDHDVELKGALDTEKIETVLTGPEAFAHAVGDDKAEGRIPQLAFNWYKIVRPVKQPVRELTIRDAEGKEQTIRIGDAAYLLSPAQRITTGAPDPLPAGLNNFRAYEVEQGPELNRHVQLRGTLGSGERTIIKVAYICLPVEQWHHDDQVPVTNRRSCLLVYALNPEDHHDEVTTLDQFGLNGLKTRASSWLCLPVQLVETGTDGKKPH